MTQTVMKINGIKHIGTWDDLSQKYIYEPPLPEVSHQGLQGILESRVCPGIKDDTTFFGNRGTLDSQFKNDPWYLKKITSNAQAAGYTPRPNDVYFASLARYPGDPKAFVSQADGLGAIKKRAEERGLRCDEGPIKTVKKEFKEDPLANSKRLADDIRDNLVTVYKAQPENEGKSTQELRDIVVDKHGAKS